MKNMKDIDKEMAERVMGWLWQPFGASENKPGQWLDKDRNPILIIESDNLRYLNEFHPSTKISQAFEVVEQLKKSSWQMHLFSMVEGTRVVFYKSFRDWRELKEHDYSVSDSPAMAICLAALKVVESQNNKGI